MRGLFLDGHFSCLFHPDFFLFFTFSLRWGGVGQKGYGFASFCAWKASKGIKFINIQRTKKTHAFRSLSLSLEKDKTRNQNTVK